MTKHLIVALALVTASCGRRHEPAPREAPGSGSATPGSGAGSAVAAGPAGIATHAPPPYAPAADVPTAIKTAVTAADRSVDDHMLDAGRKPGEVFAFFEIAPGEQIGELFAGGGYTTELLARIVGDSGKVYAQNTKEIMDKFARKPWTERAAKRVMRNVVAVELPADAPFPPEAKDLDTVVTILNYHDFVWQKVDMAKLNRAVFAALKPGGVYAIVDSSAEKGSGIRDTETLHRIDEEVVKKDVTAAGFTLEAESDVLRRPEDTRDWSSSPTSAGAKRGTSDRFALRFVKPAK